MKTNAVKGTLTPKEALGQMLAGTGLVVSPDAASGALAVRKGAPDPNAERAAPATPSGRPGPSAKNEEIVTLSPFEANPSQD